MQGSIYQQLHRCLEEDRLVALATVVEGPGTGRQMLLFPSGERVGGLENPALEEAVADAAETVFRSFGTERVEADGSVVFVEAHPPAPKLVIVGAVHTAIPLVTFANEQGRDAYLPHPAHEAFKKIVGPHLDKVLVVDYWAKD